MDVVQREEFEAAREMAVKARAENKKLAARIDALEAQNRRIRAGAKAAQPRGIAAKPRNQKNNSLNFSTKPDPKKRFCRESLIRHCMNLCDSRFPHRE